jgi:hypothetical protein
MMMKHSFGGLSPDKGTDKVRLLPQGRDIAEQKFVAEE